ncbi:MAG: alanine racemase [Oscillospiraceae bacterium]|nr:alanine racemase [Oscillospiraceae bacterium]
MNNFYWRTWAEINLDTLKSNIKEIEKLADGKELIAIVKANAYGHGDTHCAAALNRCGIRHFAVSNLWEAQGLTAGGIEGDILIFGYCDIPLIFENLDRHYIFTVGTTEYAKLLSDEAIKRGVKVPVHIKFDTGMSRVGITTAAEADFILSQEGLDCRAGYTHFAVADSLDEENMEFTRRQQKALQDICRSRGLKMHSQNSGGILYHGECDGDFVRAGIIMYGHKPDAAFPFPDGIKPVMQLKTVVSQLKTIPEGTTVSYGRTFTAQRDTKLALIACGYADGFNRRLSGQWSCEVNGGYAPVCGRICMDQTLIDVTDIPDVKIGDVVTVYSNELEGGCSMERAAELIGTINYELLCAIGTRVPRIYIEDGQETEVQRYV